MDDPSAWDLGAVLTVIAIVVTVVVGLLGVFAGFVIYRAIGLGEAENCEDVKAEYTARLDPQGWERYRAALQRLLGGIDGFFRFDGYSRFWRPYGVCLKLAIVYPILFYLIGYVFAGAGGLAANPLFDGNAHWAARVFLVAYIILGAGLFFAALRFDWFERVGRIVGRRFARFGRPMENVVFVFVVVAVVVAVVVVVAIGVATFAIIGAGAGVVAVAAAAAGAVAGTVAGAGAGPVDFAVAVAIFFIGGDPILPIVYLAFFVAFPIINAFLDLASIAVTRALIRRWVRERRGAWRAFLLYLWSIFWDLVAAVFCVTVLAGALTAGMAGLRWLIARFGEGSASVDWMANMNAFRTDPLGDGLMVTLMLFSTLVPTVFHLAAGTIAYFKMPHFGRQFVLDAVADGPPAFTQRIRVASVMILPWAISLLIWVAIGLLFLRFFVPLKWLGLGDDGTLLTWLPFKAAEWVWGVLVLP